MSLLPRAKPSLEDYLIAGRVLGVVGQAALLTLFARDTSVAAFGAMNAQLGAMSFLQAPLDLGLTGLILRDGRTSSATTRAALSFARRVSPVLLALSTIIAFVLQEALGLSNWTILLGVWCVTERLSEMMLAGLIASGDGRPSVISAINRRAGTLALYILLESRTGAEAAYATALTISVIVDYWYVSRATRKVYGEAMGGSLALLRRSRHFAVASVAAQVRSLDVLLVSLVAGEAVAGLYAVPARLITPLRLIPTTLAQGTLARWGGTKGVRIRTTLHPVRRHLSAFLLLIVATALLTPWGVPAVLGMNYRAAVVPTLIVLLAVVLAAGTSILTALRQATGDEARAGSSATFGVTVTFCAIMILAPRLGAIGAALAIFVGFSSQLWLLAARGKQLTW